MTITGPHIVARQSMNRFAGSPNTIALSRSRRFTCESIGYNKAFIAMYTIP